MPQENGPPVAQSRGFGDVIPDKFWLPDKFPDKMTTEIGKL